MERHGSRGGGNRHEARDVVRGANLAAKQLGSEAAKVGRHYYADNAVFNSPFTTQYSYKKSAYTLAEIIIVLVVIAVVVAATMRVAKTRLDNITTYTYYAAYSVLNDVTGQMLADFNPNKDDYIKTSYSFWNNLFPKAIGETKVVTKYSCAQERYQYNDGNGFRVYYTPMKFRSSEVENIESLNNCVNMTPWYETTPFGEMFGFQECPGKTKYSEDISGYFNFANLEKTFAPEKAFSCTTSCRGSSATNCGAYSSIIGDAHWFCPGGSSLMTPIGNKWPICIETYTGSDSCIPISEEQQRKDYCEYGKTDYDSSTCTYKTQGTDCPSGQRWNKNEPNCGCVPEDATVPRTGKNFCEMFVSLANTKAGEMCKGTKVEADTTDFSGITEDIILRNGMKIYNASQNPDSIADLVGNETGGTVTKTDGTTFDTNIAGYTLYVDIDGSSGESKLWEDVFPFYVTLSGKVIPAYKTDALGEFGGDSRYYMQTSIQVDAVDSVGATQYWLLKSKSFKESACKAGYVGQNTLYCSRHDATNPAVTKDTICSQEQNSCSVKKVSPIRGF